MKAIVINADPKRKGINAQFAKSALKGAESVGAEVEYIDLYKLELSGCRVCLICKRDDEVCKCYWRDELSPLIEDIFNADARILIRLLVVDYDAVHYVEVEYARFGYS